MNSGYWRSSINSTNVIKCNEAAACIGGTSGPYNETTNSYPLCDKGYGGNLCGKCVKYNGINYGKQRKTKCVECPKFAMNVLLLTLVAVAILSFLLILIITNIKKTTESDLSVLLRILTNYM